MSAKIAASAAAAAVLLACPGAAGAAEPEFVPGELLVRFDPGVGKAESNELAAGQGGDVIERYGIVPRLALVDLPAGLGVEEAENRFERLDGVSFAQPNRIYREALAPDDEFYVSSPNALWSLDNAGQVVPAPTRRWRSLSDPPFIPANPRVPSVPDADIDAPEAWDSQTGDPAVTVGVIDSGLTVAHEDIAPNLWVNDDPVDGLDDDLNGLVDDINGWDFVENDNTPDDASGHGSHVAGSIGAQGDNAVGTTGAAWDVSLAGLKAGSADGRLYSDAIIDAIEYADDEGIPIVNGSFIGTGSNDPSDVERIAYQNADDTLFVVAAGNSAIDADNTANNAVFPCAYTLPNIVCVAATTPSDGLASFSNFGDANVDVGAPGTNALSTEPKFGAPVFEDDFEDGNLDEWIVESGTWANASEEPNLPAGPGRALTDSPGDNYLNNEDSPIRMKDAIDLTGRESCRLSAASAFTLGAGDALEVEYTTDPIPGPSAVWVQLYRQTTPYVGNGGFAFRNLDLDMRGATGQPGVRIRFRLETNSFGTAEGVHLDNVKIECVDPAPASQAFYRVRQGTSMASPVVAGVAALVLSDDPGQDLTVEQLRTTILASVDPVAALRCKTATGGRVNAATALAISPAAGPPPAPDCSTPGPTVQTPVVDPPIVQPKVVKPKPKCKKPKKGASAKAKTKFKKCKKKLAKKG